MTMIFDRAYYEANMLRNQKLADEAAIPSIREVHLDLAEFYRRVIADELGEQEIDDKADVAAA